MIEIEIYGQGNQQITGCTGCRKTMPLGNAVLGLQRLCHNRYGDKVTVRLVNPDSTFVRGNTQIAHLVFKHRNNLPVVTLNGEVICIGELPKSSIYELVDRAMGIVNKKK